MSGVEMMIRHAAVQGRISHEAAVKMIASVRARLVEKDGGQHEPE